MAGNGTSEAASSGLSLRDNEGRKGVGIWEGGKLRRMGEDGGVEQEHQRQK